MKEKKHYENLVMQYINFQQRHDKKQQTLNGIIVTTIMCLIMKMLLLNQINHNHDIIV